jgi:hypothetical protein
LWLRAPFTTAIAHRALLSHGSWSSACDLERYVHTDRVEIPSVVVIISDVLQWRSLA